MKQEIFELIEICGTISFAVSGVFAAMQRKLDLFGILIIAFITSIGGGTLRDLLIGDLPVNWMRGVNYPVIILASAIITIFFHSIVRNFQRTLFIFDSLGLGFFTILGVQKGLAFGFHPGIAVALGMITGCFGGVIRDIALNNIPIIFHKEIYATACLVGGALYILLRYWQVNSNIIDVISISVIFLIRVVAVYFHLTLPSLYPTSKNDPSKDNKKSTQ